MSTQKKIKPCKMCPNDASNSGYCPYHWAQYIRERRNGKTLVGGVKESAPVPKSQLSLLLPIVRRVFVAIAKGEDPREAAEKAVDSLDALRDNVPASWLEDDGDGNKTKDKPAYSLYKDAKPLAPANTLAPTAEARIAAQNAAAAAKELAAFKPGAQEKDDRPVVAMKVPLKHEGLIGIAKLLHGGWLDTADLDSEPCSMDDFQEQIAQDAYRTPYWELMPDVRDTIKTIATVYAYNPNNRSDTEAVITLNSKPYDPHNLSGTERQAALALKAKLKKADELAAKKEQEYAKARIEEEERLATAKALHDAQIHVTEADLDPDLAAFHIGDGQNGPTAPDQTLAHTKVAVTPENAAEGLPDPNPAPVKPAFDPEEDDFGPPPDYEAELAAAIARKEAKAKANKRTAEEFLSDRSYRTDSPMAKLAPEERNKALGSNMRYEDADDFPSFL